MLEPSWFPRMLLLFLLLMLSLVDHLHGGLPEPHRPAWDSHAQYGVIVDAGSTGSRVRVYTWNATSHKPWATSPYAPVRRRRPPPPAIRETRSFKVRPGVSSLAGNASQLALHVCRLLLEAESAIPKSVRDVTSIYFMATAGEFFQLV